ncbi:S41 family peptidase [bacterium]|jgi:carboxyl-terminal processing protease|nr:S41 family peptidase [bacterium]MBT4335164.1 S41 family peptidase [bacterium]MBT4495905.1 S41 family peptidase [bacterium]MBT4764073.1 S41 family peptidase [bacterium]MBT5401445.1 S41 family peptidase [bacterium]
MESYSNLPSGYNLKNKKIILGVSLLILAIIIFFIGLVVGLNKQLDLEKSPSGIQDTGRVLNTDALPEYLAKDVNFKLFWKVWDIIRSKYIDRDQITDAQLFYGSMKGVVAALGDPYSVFLDPVISEEFTEELSGKFQGIGAEIGMKQERLTIISPLPESPAEKAGLKPGDKVMAIDGNETTGISLDEAVKQIRGEKGTEVILTVARENADSFLDITITRDTIDIKSVVLEMKDNIGYIKLTHFNQDTAQEFGEIVNELLTKSPKGVILDLRNNAGGYLDVAIEIAGYWVKNGDVVVKESFGDVEIDRNYNSTGQEQLASYKTVVIVNGGSASASEIVAGALQDFELANVVGEVTFGKGSVQELEQLSDGSSVKITIARWLTPFGRSIDKEGVAPDEIVEFTEENYENEEDPQLDRALEIINNE